MLQMEDPRYLTHIDITEDDVAITATAACPVISLNHPDPLRRHKELRLSG